MKDYKKTIIITTLVTLLPILLGIILWEMLSEDTPFKGRCPVQIMNAVCTLHERPIMPIGVPKELDELVRLCWAQTPEERPTFKMIYKMFKEKKLAFAGTDFSAVDECVRRIEKAQEELKKAGYIG